MALTHAAAIESFLKKQADPVRARLMQRFFRTGKGDYGEGDRFLGLTVPQIRSVARSTRELSFNEVKKLLRSVYHEARMLALYTWVWQYSKGDDQTKEKIYHAYLAHTRYINNWDLVDTTAEHIIGAHLDKRDRKILRQLALSGDLWKKRIAMLACFHFIRKNDFETAMEIAHVLVNDEHDLIHKAVGWMLREIGKRDIKITASFLDQFAATMPRTMLRYSLEKFPRPQKEKYMKMRGTRS